MISDIGSSSYSVSHETNGPPELAANGLLTRDRQF
jgi:hypothetical protein